MGRGSESHERGRCNKSGLTPPQSSHFQNETLVSHAACSCQGNPLPCWYIVSMKKVPVVLLLTALASLAVSLVAQTTEDAQHAPDGGTSEMIQSISIPALANAPFSCIVTSELVKKLEDGSSITLQNHRLVMRDGVGRIFQERRSFVPKAGTKEPELMRLEISDPIKHEKYFCSPRLRSCELYYYFSPASSSNAKGQGDVTSETLGNEMVSGLEASGVRETRHLAPGTIGNDSELSITKEFWYSRQLGINLLVKRFDPRYGTQTFSVTDLSVTEPDVTYFSVPAGYSIIDRRSKRPGGGTAR